MTWSAEGAGAGETAGLIVGYKILKDWIGCMARKLESGLEETHKLANKETAFAPKNRVESPLLYN